MPEEINPENCDIRRVYELLQYIRQKTKNSETELNLICNEAEAVEKILQNYERDESRKYREALQTKMSLRSIKKCRIKKKLKGEILAEIKNALDNIFLMSKLVRDAETGIEYGVAADEIEKNCRKIVGLIEKLKSRP